MLTSHLVSNDINIENLVYRWSYKLTRRVHGDRVTDFFKNFCEIKVSLCSNKMTNPYDPLFRNTRENRVNTR